MNRFITKYLTIWLIGLLGLSLSLSFSVEARYANQVVTLDKLRIQQPAQAVTVCFYRPKVWVASYGSAANNDDAQFDKGIASKAFTVRLNGHVSCNLENGLGSLYYLKHTFK